MASQLNFSAAISSATSFRKCIPAQGRRIRCTASRSESQLECYDPSEQIQKPYLPTKADICRAAMAQNMKLQLKTWGPYFKVEATSLTTGKELGTANGFITAWFGVDGRILHLESLRMVAGAFQSQNSFFGSGLLVGAMAVRHGYDCNCTRAELLALNDSELYHSKLVRYYTRLGFKTVCEVTGSSWRDIGHMLVWGAVGTRMDAEILDLLVKWSGKFKNSV